MKIYLTSEVTPEPDLIWTNIRPGSRWRVGADYPTFSRVQFNPRVFVGPELPNVWKEYEAAQTVPAGTFPDASQNTAYWNRYVLNPDEDFPWWGASVTYQQGHQVYYDHYGSNLYHIYESLINNNTGNNPETGDGTKWVKLGPANAAAMFDPRNNTATRYENERQFVDPLTLNNAYGMSFSLLVPRTCPAICLLGMKNVESVLVRQIATDSTVLAVSQIENARQKKSLIFNLLDVAGNDYYHIEVYLYAPTGDDGPDDSVVMSVSNVVVSSGVVDVGNTQWGVEPNFSSYSTFDTNEYGSTTFVPRQAQREVRYTIELETEYFDWFYATAQSLTQRLAVFDGNNEGTDYDSLRVYGTLTSIKAGLQYGWTFVDLTVKGYT